MRYRLGSLVLISSLVAWSAAAAQKSTTVGPVVGLNIATFGGADAENVSSRTAFLIGGFAAFQLSPKFLLEPSVLYTEKGGEVDFEEDINGTIKLTYLQVPVLGRYRLGSGKAVPNLIFGPAVGFKIGCNASGNAGPIEINVDCDEADVPVSSTDFSLIGGVGLEVSKFMFSLRYDYGLSAVPSEGDAKVYNRTVSLVGQYGFRLK
jgi:hypothetical protein